MMAQLRAITFDVSPEGPQRRAIQSTAPVEWSWLVRSRAAGRQDVVIELDIPAVVNGTVSEISTDVLQNLPITIQVEGSVTPPPVATPGTFWTSVSKSIADNSGPIIIALIGLAGTLIGILVKTRSDSTGSKRQRK